MTVEAVTGRTEVQIQVAYACTTCGNEVRQMANQPAMPTACCNCAGTEFKVAWQQQIKTVTTIIPIAIIPM